MPLIMSSISIKKGNMKYIKKLPYESILGDDQHECVLWSSNENVCEFQTDEKSGQCDTSGFYYGTSDQIEPKFCARHFYQEVVSGDGKSNYKLVDIKL